MMKQVLAFLARWTLIGRLVDSHQAYVRNLSRSGNAQPPSRFCWYVMRALFQIWQIFQVGRVRIVGAKNLQHPGRVIYCPNHSSFLDAVVMQPTFRKPVRGIGAFEVFRQCFGLVGMVLSKLGVIPVDRSQGKTVLGPATKAVAAGDSMVIFPEGKVSVTGELLEFKLGPAYIAKAVYDMFDGEEDVCIVPVHICYGKRDEGSACNFLKMGWKWRGGATVTVLDPIKLSQLQDHSPEYIMQLVRNAITSVPCRTCSCHEKVG